MKKLILMIVGVVVAVAAHASEFDFNVKVTGEGKPMILIPGLNSHGDTYIDVVEHYKNDYECHVLTLPGFAGQPANEYDQYLRSMRDQILDYVESNGLADPVIMPLTASSSGRPGKRSCNFVKFVSRSPPG